MLLVIKCVLVQLTFESAAMSLTQEQRDWVRDRTDDVPEVFKQPLVLLWVQKPDAIARQLCTYECHHWAPRFHLDVQV